MAKRILVIGDVNLDLVLSGLAHLPHAEEDVAAQGLDLLVGGQGATIARALARLGLRVRIVGRVGQDEYGRRALQELQADGVDTAGLALDPDLRTGITVILSAGTERGFATYVGSISATRRDDITREMLQNADHLHVSSFYMHTLLRPDLPELLDEAHLMGLSISVDPGWDPTNEWRSDIFENLKHIDIFLPNDLEARTITATHSAEQAMDALAGTVETVVIKRGAQGALARRGARVSACPAFPVELVDVTCAGDVFDAGFLYGYLAKWDMERTLTFANACGALATTRVGSLGLMQGVREIEAFIEAHPRGSIVQTGPLEQIHDS